MGELNPMAAFDRMGAAMNGAERRRTTPRMTCFGDIHFEPNNGGIVLNVSEGGLCFHSIAPVHRNGPIRFWFSLDRQRIQAAGEFVWMDHTQQTGGLRFTALPAVGREAIRNRTREGTRPSLDEEEARPSQLALRSYVALSSTRRAAKADAAGSTELAVVSATPTGIMRWKSWSSFSGGMAMGILVSAVIVVALLLLTNRQQFGRSIIWLGERVAANQQTQTVTPPGPVASAVPSPSTPPGSSPTQPAFGRAAAPVSMAQQDRLVPQTLAEVAKPPQAPLEKQEQLAEPATVRPRVGGVSHPKVPASAGVVTMAAAAPTISGPTMDASPNSNLVAGKPTPVAPTWPTNDRVVQTQDSGKGNPAQTPEMYFQVGRFKDESSAKSRTDELADLGFPASDIQKSRLWSNFYAVLVGPYDENAEAKAARKDLVSHGFKPQPLEKGSRDFRFSHTLTVNGAQLPVGNCTVRWESYGNVVSVEFVQDKNVITSVDGKWVNQRVRYDSNAFAYIRGSGSLVEIRFAGMARTLVFGK
jgi:cell division protein FtsN